MNLDEHEKRSPAIYPHDNSPAGARCVQRGKKLVRREYQLRPFVGLLFAVLVWPVSGALLHDYDVGGAGTFHNAWNDNAGSNNLAVAAGVGGATAVVFTDDPRASCSRAFTATNANLNAGAASGLPTASYTFELWLHFGGAISPGQVIFETGGGNNGIGLFTRANGLEMANASITTGANAVAAVSLADLDLTYYVQVIGVFDTGANQIKLIARDVNGVSVTNAVLSANPLHTDAGNGMSLFAGGNGTYNNVASDIGGALATGVTLPGTPGVFSGKMALFRIHSGVDLAAPATSYAAFVLPASRAADPHPNFIIILTDDHGYADIKAQMQNADITTPNIDRLANEGVRFTRGYVTAPQCVPSRAGIISGRYQQRFGVDANGKGPMDLSVTTIPERLRQAGYRTGMIGKWHLEPDSSCTEWAAANGVDPNAIPDALRKQYFPGQQGFEEYGKGEMNTYWRNYNRDGSNNDPLGAQQAESGFRCDIQSDFAEQFIARNHDRRFFLYLAYYVPHVPLEWVARYANSFDPALPVARLKALGMIKAVDDGVGRIVTKLQQYGIDEKTVIWFLGDNGAPLGFHQPGDVGMTDATTAWDGSLNTPCLGEKGMLAQGGICVPWLMRWPGTVQPQVYTNPVISLDMGATANALAGLSDDPALDGVNLVPFLTGTNTNAPHQRLFFRFWDQSALLDGKWKYIKPSASTPPLLFDFESDAQETQNLIGQHPDIAASMNSTLEAWKAGLLHPGDLGPTLNAQELPWYKRHFGLGLGYDFNTDGNAEGWTPIGVTGNVVTNGEWRGEVSAGATLTQPDFLVMGASVHRLLIKTRVPQSGTVQVQWTHRDATNFSPSRSVSLPVVASSAPQWLIFPMQEQPEWNGKIVTQLRLVFTSSGGQEQALDYVRASDGDYDRDSIEDITDGATDRDGDGLANFEDTDSDGDSLSDFSEGTMDVDGNGLANFVDLDSDGDKQPDRIESLLGTSPYSNAEGLAAAIGRDVSNRLSVSALPGKTGLIYSLWTSTNLVGSGWAKQQQIGPLSTNGPVVFTTGTTSPAAFFRIQVEEAPPAPPPPPFFDGFLAGGAPAQYNVAAASGQNPSSLTGFGSAWGAGDATIETNGLTHASMTSAGGKLQISKATNGGNGNNTRVFSTNFTDGTFYLGFLLRCNRSSGALQANLRLQNNGTDIARIGQHNAVLGLADTVVKGATQPADGAVHCYIVKAELHAVGTDTLSLFLDPAPGSTEPAAALASMSGEFSFDGFRIFDNPGSSTLTIVEFDEFRLATNWAGVLSP